MKVQENNIANRKLNSNHEAFYREITLPHAENRYEICGTVLGIMIAGTLLFALLVICAKLLVTFPVFIVLTGIPIAGCFVMRHFLSACHRKSASAIPENRQTGIR